MENKLEALYGLRGFAVLWVVLFHACLTIPSSILPNYIFASRGVGVDIFFLLSGFLIMRAHMGMTISAAGWGAFLVKRAFRLYPTHIAIMLLLALKVLIRPPTGTWVEYYDWHVFPYVLTLTATDFGFTAYHWNYVVWFLNVEVACALLVPVLVTLLARAPLVLVAPLLAASLGLEALSLTDLAGDFDPTTDGARSFARGITGFTSGMLLFLLWRRWPRGFAGFDLIAIFFYFAVSFSPFAMLTPIPACGVIAALASERGMAARITRTGPLHYFGQISLSLYLIHTPVLNPVRHLLPILARLTDFAWANALTAFLAVALSVIAAVIVNRIVERPGIQLGNRIVRSMAARFGQAV